MAKSLTRALFRITGLCLAVGLGIASSWAQAVQPNRVEYPIERAEDAYEIFPLEENGLMLFRRLRETGFSGDYPLEFAVLDTALQERWRRVQRVDDSYSLIGFDYHQDSAYFLFDHYDRV